MAALAKLPNVDSYVSDRVYNGKRTTNDRQLAAKHLARVKKVVDQIKSDNSKKAAGKK